MADCWVISQQCRALGAARNKDADVVFGLSVIDGLVNIEFAGRTEKTVDLDRFAPDRDHLDLETGPLQSGFRQEVLLFLKTVGDEGGDFSFRRHVNPPASVAVFRVLLGSKLGAGVLSVKSILWICDICVAD